jgi:hypothetical protein
LIRSLKSICQLILSGFVSPSKYFFSAFAGNCPGGAGSAPQNPLPGISMVLLDFFCPTPGRRIGEAAFPAFRRVKPHSAWFLKFIVPGLTGCCMARPKKTRPSGRATEIPQ